MVDFIRVITYPLAFPGQLNGGEEEVRFGLLEFSVQAHLRLRKRDAQPPNLANYF